MRAAPALLAVLVAAAWAAAGEGAGGGPPPASDVARGRVVYERCQGCHSLAADRVGPRHCGLFGRRAGSVPGFPYSPAMRRSGIVWDRRSLDRFLEDPLGSVPGTTMGYAGVSDPVERAQLLAFLAVASRGASCGSQP